MRQRLIVQAAVSLLLACAVLVGCQPRPAELPKDTQAPVFSGIHPIEILQGDGVAYRNGVSAVDDVDGEVSFSVDASSVDPNKAGVYSVTYRAADKAGNERIEKTTVTVVARKVTYEQLWEKIDALIAQKGYRGLSCGALSENLYYDVKAMLSYVSDSDKSDWVAEAYRALTEKQGDCFTYYAVARAFFERLGFEVITVERMKGAMESTHFWLLVNTGSREAPAWYHWDACPHYKEYPLTSILLTDAQLLEYHKQVDGYYAFDQTLYPPTPETPFEQ